MKISLISTIAVLLLTGCASTHEVARHSAPVYPEGSIVQDQHYVAVVEDIARNRGIHVTWINPPKKRIERTVTKP